jgi:hypothetical protein
MLRRRSGRLFDILGQEYAGRRWTFDRHAIQTLRGVEAGGAGIDDPLAVSADGNIKDMNTVA